MYFLGQMIGGALMFFILYSALLFIYSRFTKAGIKTRIGYGLAVYALCGTLYAHGSANGGEPEYIKSFAYYLMPCLLVVGLDIHRSRN